MITCASVTRLVVNFYFRLLPILLPCYVVNVLLNYDVVLGRAAVVAVGASALALGTTTGCIILNQNFFSGSF